MSRRVGESKNAIEWVCIGHMTDCLVPAPHALTVHARNVQIQQPTLAFYLMPQYSKVKVQNASLELFFANICYSEPPRELGYLFLCFF